MKYWSTKIPTNEGWYWVRYKGKRGIVVCPAQFVLYETVGVYIHTARNDVLVPRVDKFHVGDSIEVPNSSLNF